VTTAVIDAFEGEQGYIRMIVTRGDGPLGIDPSTRRLPADGLDPRIKSLNYLNHILARIEANRAGADEAVLLNTQGRVAEGTADNLFIVRDGRLLTPPVIDGALPGITRALILELAGEMGIETCKQSLAP